MFCVCHAFLSVHCSFVVTCWDKAYLLSLLYVMFYCVFVTFPCGVLGQVWFLIVSISDPCLHTYFEILAAFTNSEILAGIRKKGKNNIQMFVSIH